MPVINFSLPFTFGPDPFRIVEKPMFGSSSNQYTFQVCLDTAAPGESVKFHRHHSSFFVEKWHLSFFVEKWQLEQGYKELKIARLCTQLSPTSRERFYLWPLPHCIMSFWTRRLGYHSTLMLNPSVVPGWPTWSEPAKILWTRRDGLRHHCTGWPTAPH